MWFSEYGQSGLRISQLGCITFQMLECQGQVPYIGKRLSFDQLKMILDFSQYKMHDKTYCIGSPFDAHVLLGIQIHVDFALECRCQQRNNLRPLSVCNSEEYRCIFARDVEVEYLHGMMRFVPPCILRPQHIGTRLIVAEQVIIIKHLN